MTTSSRREATPEDVAAAYYDNNRSRPFARRGHAMRPPASRPTSTPIFHAPLPPTPGPPLPKPASLVPWHAPATKEQKLSRAPRPNHPAKHGDPPQHPSPDRSGLGDQDPRPPHDLRVKEQPGCRTPDTTASPGPPPQLASAPSPHHPHGREQQRLRQIACRSQRPAAPQI